MAEKMSWSELRRVLASRAGVTEKKAGTFLNSMTALLIEALKRDRQVKINGLGTFKLQAVAPRKSVNVTTGEEITIEGYNKLVFSPESGVKELVEKGASPSKSEKRKAKGKKQKTNEEIDPLQKLGVQAAEIVDILSELGQGPKEEPVIPKEEPVIPKEEPVIPKEEPIIPTAPEVTEVPKPAEKQTVVKPKKKYHFWRDTLICVIVLLMLLVVGFFFFRKEVSDWIQSLVGKNEPTAVTAQPSTVSDQPSEISIEPEEFIEQPSEVIEQPAEEAEEEEIIGPEEEVVYEQWLKTEAITEGSRLAWIAKKYYGAKIYWPYLYDANKDHLDNPNKIAVGTPIRVPKLTALQKDTTNAKTMETIERLREQALSK